MTALDWAQFRLNNPDPQGIEHKFEDLCRQLFANEYIKDNKLFRFLHSNPSNAGLETDPILDEKTNRRVGFQAKFFKQRPDYDQIHHSIKVAIENYRGKVDHIILFSNVQISSTTRSTKYKDAVEMLARENITIELVTDTEVLDLVRKYPYLGLYYFGRHSLSHEWFAKYSDLAFNELGERFNQQFNVDTTVSNQLSLFVEDSRGIEYINNKKAAILNEINNLFWKQEKYHLYFNTIEETVKKLPDIDRATIMDCFEWEEKVREATKDCLSELKKEYENLNRGMQEQFEIAFSSSKTEDREKRRKARASYYEYNEKLEQVRQLLNISTIVGITDDEKKLLSNNVLLIAGAAGTGKTQLLANETARLIASERYALLLVSGMYCTSDPIHNQIMNNLQLDYSLVELIDILEAIGEKENQIVPIFVDALNETMETELWRREIPILLDKINSCPMVKLVMTYRFEFEKLLISDGLRQQISEGTLLRIEHHGFQDNSFQAIREFLNHYSIPFSPLEYFGYEMSNPLFLTLYCKTYNGEEVDLPTLYRRVVEQANSKIYYALKNEMKQKGYSEIDGFLMPFILELARFFITNHARHISLEELYRLDYWSHYGFTPATFIRQLVKENVLYDSVYEGKISYHFAYDQMNDYYCAEAIVNMLNDKNDVRACLKEQVLGIKEGEVENPGNTDLFVNACVLYYIRYGEECIDIIDEINDGFEKDEVIRAYLSSYQWRECSTITEEQFIRFVKKYNPDPESVWRILISNSVKIHHPLNARFLHGKLYAYQLNKRDYVWTEYINTLTVDDSDRVVQLVEMYNKGEKLDAVDMEQTELLLTLLCWLLTSTNRWLRDVTSKAMVEILRSKMQLCMKLLIQFDGVNDPYVYERLFGIVFGAYCKQINHYDCTELVEYVYSNVFDKETVYPDILLRDYARLIVEKYMYENPDYRGIIQKEKIIPPYNSEPIPEIEDQHYDKIGYSDGLSPLISSMRFNGMGMYGDFGRYIYQSALYDFDVDEKKVFNYTIYFILNELKYTTDYFGDYDKKMRTYDRHATNKIERIGKKYQWIAMHNILARISDHVKKVDRFGSEEVYQFEGAWEPFVRDFDPTLNGNSMSCPDAPKFEIFGDLLEATKNENRKMDVSAVASRKQWLKDRGVFIDGVKNSLKLTDEQKREWIVLSMILDTGIKRLKEDQTEIWSKLYGRFITEEQMYALQENVEAGRSIVGHQTTGTIGTYRVFNREYPWSPSCKALNEDAWTDAYLGTGEYEEEIETTDESDTSIINMIWKKWGIDVGIENVQESPREVVQRKEIKKPIGRLLEATVDFDWESQYDGSKEGTISWSAPCAELITTMHLQQIEYDGFYYDAENRLAAFDLSLTQDIHATVIRKDLLDEFLRIKKMKLVWISELAKEIHSRDDLSIMEWSEWEALFVYDGITVNGKFYHRKRPDRN